MKQARSRQRIVRAAELGQVRRMNLKVFDSRPVNYFFDMINVEESLGRSEISDVELQQAVETAVEHERIALAQRHRQELQSKFEEGVAQGIAQAAKEIEVPLRLLQDYAKLLNAERQEMTRRAEEQAVKLGFELSKEIIGAELSLAPDKVLGIVRSALGQVSDAQHVTIRVSETDLNTLRDVVSSWAEYFGIRAGIDLKVDASLHSGDCMIESDRGLLDARVESQLAALREQLTHAETRQ